MKFIPLSLQDAFLIELERKEDERGFFARSFCQDTFKKQGLPFEFAQCNVSFNIHKGTIRGMHYQIGDNVEAKLVRCTSGFIHDVIIDLRKDSKTYLKWTAVELSAENRKMLFVPSGFAHGFQTLEDNTELFYQMSIAYTPGFDCGLLWNDPFFNIKWPFSKPSVISQKDQQYPNFIPE